MSYLPAIRTKSAFVSLPHHARVLPRICFHSPSKISLFNEPSLGLLEKLSRVILATGTAPFYATQCIHRVGLRLILKIFNPSYTKHKLITSAECWIFVRTSGRIWNL